MGVLSTDEPVVLAIRQRSPLVIFANPIAGKGRGWAVAQELRARLKSEGIESKIICQNPADTPQDVPAEAVAMIVIGGDGTLRAAIRRCIHVRGNAPPVLLFPMGTANLMGKHFGISWTPAEAVEALLRGVIRQIDLPRANGEVFLVMTGIGFDATVVRELNRYRTGPIRYASYVIPTLWSLAHYQFPPLEVRVDGELVFPAAPAMAFVGNIAEYGTGFPFLPLAKPDDGLLDVCVMPIDSRLEILEQFALAASGEQVNDLDVVYVRGKDVLIESPRQVPVQVDGDPAGCTPLHIDLLPSRLAFIVPG